MPAIRKDDRKPNGTWFRSDRLVEDGGRWFFLTREGTIEGPFESRLQAVQRLEVYVRIMSLDLLPAPDQQPSLEVR